MSGFSIFSDYWDYTETVFFFLTWDAHNLLQLIQEQEVKKNDFGDKLFTESRQEGTHFKQNEINTFYAYFFVWENIDIKFVSGQWFFSPAVLCKADNWNVLSNTYNPISFKTKVVTCKWGMLMI